MELGKFIAHIISLSVLSLLQAMLTAQREDLLSSEVLYFQHVVVLQDMENEARFMCKYSFFC